MSENTMSQQKENQLHLAFEWLQAQAEHSTAARLLCEEIIRLRTLEQKNKK